MTRCGLVERSGQGMNLIYEDLIKQSKPAPDFSRTDQYQVGLTLHGTVQDPAFIGFVENVSRETTAFFSTHDWLLMSAASQGERAPKGAESRVARLVELGIIERGRGRSLMLSRRFYEFVGKTAAYTRKKGLDREHNLALLKKHIEENKAIGSKLDELCQVLPSLPKPRFNRCFRLSSDGGTCIPLVGGEQACGIQGSPRKGGRVKWIVTHNDVENDAKRDGVLLRKCLFNK